MINLTDRNKILIYGMTIGDGYIHKRDCYLQIIHQEKQREYLVWKRQLLIDNGFPCGEIISFNNNGFPSVKTQTKMDKNFFKPIRKEIYTPYKHFTREILNLFTPLELTIWYFDDGGISQKRRNGKIVANDLMINTGLQKEDNQVYIDYFKESWGIHFSQVKNHNCYRLRCGTKEARKFIDIIKPYAEQVPSMRYKLLVKERYFSMSDECNSVG